MKLRSFLYEMDMTLTKFAEILGITPTYLSNIATGKYAGGKRLRRDIERLTGGKVEIPLEPRKKRKLTPPPPD
jgi:transcriptional regulator with XRE-family HTH domain